MRIRGKVSGTAERPRLAVSASNRNVFVQLIDDEQGVTLASATGRAAAEIGEEIVGLANDKGIARVVADRGGHKYHGRVKAVIDAALKAGLLTGEAVDDKETT